MTNRLAAHVTTWKWWYALLAMPAFLLGSSVTFLAKPAAEGGDPTLAAFMAPLSFLAFAGLSLAFIALVARRWPSTGDLGLRKTLGGKEIALLVAVFAVTHLAF